MGSTLPCRLDRPAHHRCTPDGVRGGRPSPLRPGRPEPRRGPSTVETCGQGDTFDTRGDSDTVRARSRPSTVPTRLQPDAERGKLLIPRIGVRASVEQVTVDGNRDMAIPQHGNDVGWYAPGVAPGQSGDAVIDGHLDWYGVPEAIFYSLNQLQPGDEVDVISQSGLTLRFQVTDSTSVSMTDRPSRALRDHGSPQAHPDHLRRRLEPRRREYNQRLLVDASYVG